MDLSGIVGLLCVCVCVCVCVRVCVRKCSANKSVFPFFVLSTQCPWNVVTHVVSKCSDCSLFSDSVFWVYSHLIFLRFFLIYEPLNYERT